MKTVKEILVNKNVVQQNAAAAPNGDVEALLAFWTYDVRWKVTGKSAKTNAQSIQASSKSETFTNTQEKPQAGVSKAENLK